jgi:beta-N-acetylhexosaminidase
LLPKKLISCNSNPFVSLGQLPPKGPKSPMRPQPPSIASRPRQALAASLFAAISCLMLCASCQDATVSDLTKRQAPPGDSLRAVAFAWADSVLNTLDDAGMLRQLLFVPAPLPIDSAQLQSFVDQAQTGYGGILLPAAQLSDLGEYAHLRDSLPLPTWVAADFDTSALALHELPSLMQLGATASDTLAYGFGSTLGNALAAAGADMVFLSAARIVRSGFNDHDALGGTPAHVHRMSSKLVAGLKSSGIQSVLRPLPAVASQAGTHLGTYRKSANSLASYDLIPFKAIADIDTVFAQSSYLFAPEIDSALAPFSARMLRMLRHRPDGLVFSPTLSGKDSIAMAATALRCLQAGHDMVILRSQAGPVQSSLLASMANGSLPRDSVKAKALRVLTQKALLRKTTHQRSSPIPVAQALKALGQLVADASLVVLRDNRRLLPLKGGLANTKISLVAVGGPAGRALADGLSVYAPISNANLDTNGRKALLENAAKQNLVVAALYPGSKLLDHRGVLLPGALRSLGALDSLGKLVVLNFGPAQQLEGLESFGCLVQAWDATARSQTAAAQLILGAQVASGRIPFQCGPYFCYGDGLNRGGRQRLAYTIPEAVGADPSKLRRIDQIVENAIALGAFPGCQVLAAKDGRVFYHKAFGHHDYGRTRTCQLDDLYDIASVTKIAATTLMAMRAFEMDTLHFDLPLKHYLRELDSSFITIKDITPQELMIHTAGLPPGLPIYKYCVVNDSVPEVRKQLYSDQSDSAHSVPITPNLYFNSLYLDSLWQKVRCTRLDSSAGYKYSDMSMFLMQRVLERVTGTSLNRFVDSAFYRPMGLRTLCYLPQERFSLDRIAPTENDRWWRNEQVHGSVHDPSAAMFGGVGGQAGLFSNSWDLAAILYMLLNNGQYAGQQLLRPQTIQHFTNRQPNSHRGLGFDMQRVNPVLGEGMVASSAHPSTFGHLGFTGTCAWADPVNNVVFIFLSNRVYPKSDNQRINELRVRQSVQEAVYEALGLSHMVDVQDCYVE